ncbi:MAG: Calvin cycle protein CP12 [Elainellaceae cyanobacterium]
MTIHTPDQAAKRETLYAAVEEARKACETGATSSECATAWDVVEELQADRAHRQASKQKTSLDLYCDDNPGAGECRIYDT